MVIVKDNVERIVSEKDYPLYEKQGYASLNPLEKKEDERQRPLRKMTVAELKAIAEEKGIENTDSLTKAEMLKVLKDHGCN